MPRAKHKYHYLYKTTNLINEKYYYGIHSTSNLDDNYLGSGKILRYSIRKYGKENFKREILEMFDNREDLVNAEINIITENILRDKQCMNCMYGGEGFNTLGTVSIKDKNGNCFRVFNDDPRYLSGELVGVTTGKVNVKDKDGNNFQIYLTDPRYLSGELVSVSNGIVSVKDKDGNTMSVDINDPRYLSGELVGASRGMVVVKDKEENILQVDKNNHRYLMRYNHVFIIFSKIKNILKNLKKK